MQISDANDCLDITLVETLPTDLPCGGDLRLQVRVQYNSFAGDYDKIWIDAREFQSFITQLHDLEVQRQGVAMLESLSPGELRLEFRALDPTGQMGVCGQVGRWCFASQGGPYWSQISFALKFSPSLLKQYLAEFRTMQADA